MRRTRDAHPALAGCIDAAQRCIRLTEVLTHNQFANRLPGHDSIGSHMRHCLDYFTCFLRGLETGLVDYDARDRDDRVSSNPQIFRVRLEEAIETISRSEGELNRKLLLRQAVASDGRSWTVETTAERELVFLSGHCVHHLAIASLLAKLAGVEVGSELGMAYSTAVYRKNQAADSKIKKQ